MLSDAEKKRCFLTIVQYLRLVNKKDAAREHDDIMEILSAILVRGEWPRRDLAAKYGIERRKMNRSTDPGGVDGPPYWRPLAGGTQTIAAEEGARAGGDPDTPGSGREVPP